MFLFKIFKTLFLRYLRIERYRFILTVLGVALGVSVYLSIQLANNASLRAFQNSLDAISGKTNLQVLGSGLGVPEETFIKLLKLTQIENLSPIIQQTVLIKNTLSKESSVSLSSKPALLLGVDILARENFRLYEVEKIVSTQDVLASLENRNGLFIGRELANVLNVRIGSFVKIESANYQEFEIRGILKNNKLSDSMGGMLIVMDIGDAQASFNRLGYLDRIDIVLKDSKKADYMKRLIQSEITSGLIVDRPQRRGSDVQKMLGSFQLNLKVLSFISVLVGFFLIFNSMSASVVRRTKEISTLRSLGLTSFQGTTLICMEAICIGLAGSFLGVVLAFIFSRGVLFIVTKTIQNLYTFLYVADVSPSIYELMIAMCIGIVGSFFSSLWPAIKAGRIQPSRGIRVRFPSIVLPDFYMYRFIVFTIIMIILSYMASRVTPWNGVPIFGYLSALFLIASISSMSFIVVFYTSLIFNFIFSKFKLISLASHNIRRHLSRNVVTVASLSVAVAMLISLVVMINSFRETVSIWTEQTLRADFYSAPASNFIKGSKSGFVKKEIIALKNLEEVAAVDGYRSIKVFWKGSNIEVGSGNFNIVADFGNLLFLDGNSKEILRKAKKQRGSIITETFSNRFKISKGDFIVLPTPRGNIQIEIKGVFYDYTTEGGRVIIDQDFYQELWNDNSLNSIAIYLKNGTNEEKLFGKIKKTLPSNFILLDNSGLKKRVFDVFDQTFSITYVLEAIAILVAILGVATNLSSNILDRRREIGTLRAIGMNKVETIISVIFESGFLGLFACFLGMISGYFLAGILIFVINKQSFGWTIYFDFSFYSVFIYLFFVYLSSLLAGSIPSRIAAKTEIKNALRAE